MCNPKRPASEAPKSVPYAQNVLAVTWEGDKQALVRTRHLGELTINVANGWSFGELTQYPASDPLGARTFLLTLYPESKLHPHTGDVVGELRLLAGDWPSSR